jgi:hypothetical protein
MISKKTKYAINALVYLAKRREDGPVLISEISDSEHIPQKFLEAPRWCANPFAFHLVVPLVHSWLSKYINPLG